MSKIKLQYESEGLLIEHSHDADSRWSELVDGFINFLRGVGYQIENGEYVEHDARVSIDRLEELEQKERQTYIPEEFDFVKKAIDSIQIGATIEVVNSNGQYTIKNLGEQLVYTDTTMTFTYPSLLSKLLTKEITIVYR